MGQVGPADHLLVGGQVEPRGQLTCRPKPEFGLHTGQGHDPRQGTDMAFFLPPAFGLGTLGRRGVVEWSLPGRPCRVLLTPRFPGGQPQAGAGHVVQGRQGGGNGGDGQGRSPLRGLLCCRGQGGHGSSGCTGIERVRVRWGLR
ncbi:hypothetical protein ACFFX0_07115 [Citricoccus parietis]|uniref:Uncharacterized protein n=1 Tax=Citricoccus parietis TaxID=592307 RepID=A0ABV5FWA9_9MICC